MGVVEAKEGGVTTGPEGEITTNKEMFPTRVVPGRVLVQKLVLAVTGIAALVIVNNHYLVGATDQAEIKWIMAGKTRTGQGERQCPWNC